MPQLDMPMGPGGNAVQAMRPGATQNVTYTGTAGVSAAFGSNTFCVRVIATTACSIVFGASPTAVTTDVYIPAGLPEYFLVTPGQKVSAVQAASGGTLNVTEFVGG